MTCIITVLKDGVAYMAGDKMATQGDSTRIVKNSKIFKKNGVLIGCCGSFRLINVVSNALDLTDIIARIGFNSNPNVFAFEFANYLLELAYEYRFLTKEDDTPMLPNSECLIVYKGHIIILYSDFSYVILDDDVAAIGMPEVAYGILKTMTAKTNPETIIKRAMTEVSKASVGVSQDYNLLTHPYTKRSLANESF